MLCPQIENGQDSFPNSTILTVRVLDVDDMDPIFDVTQFLLPVPEAQVRSLDSCVLFLCLTSLSYFFVLFLRLISLSYFFLLSSGSYDGCISYFFLISTESYDSYIFYFVTVPAMSVIHRPQFIKSYFC